MQQSGVVSDPGPNCPGRETPAPNPSGTSASGTSAWGTPVIHRPSSTARQSLDSQPDPLTEAGVTRIFSEKISTRATQRPELDKAVALARRVVQHGARVRPRPRPREPRVRPQARPSLPA
ncbi:recombinase family protein [Streptomyces triculaminicus]|uniref:recombinase family protein n=1 Tax=Streptomyces triculaminicus TaxID=2816232 RepID=UPI003F4D6CFB